MCGACQLYTIYNPTPTSPTEMPEKAWQNHCMGFFGPMPGEDEFLVVMNEFSRMPLVESVQTTSANNVVPKLDA